MVFQTSLRKVRESFVFVVVSLYSRGRGVMVVLVLVVELVLAVLVHCLSHASRFLSLHNNHTSIH